MIDQFFTAVEEIEYDWQLPYQNVIFEEDDDRLEQIVEKWDLDQLRLSAVLR